MIINAKIKEHLDGLIIERQKEVKTTKTKTKDTVNELIALIPELEDIMETETACRETGIATDAALLDGIKKKTSIRIHKDDAYPDQYMIKYEVIKGQYDCHFAVTLRMHDEALCVSGEDLNGFKSSIVLTPDKEVSDSDALILGSPHFSHSLSMSDILAEFRENLKSFTDETFEYYKNLEL